jgi:glycine/D-amino acid oxidase-like deaminating enzyme
LRVDVLVIGGGNTGVTAAYLLKRSGKTVALIERDRCGGGDTSHTSAHLTCVTDLRIRQLVDRLGQGHAAAVLDGGLAAIGQIEANIESAQIECAYARVPGYLHGSLVEENDERDDLRRQAALAAEMGLSATYVDAVPLFARPGIRFPNQARFHPLKYLAGMLQRIPGDGSHVFEQTEAAEFGDDALEIKANGHTISYDFIVIATDVPLMGRANLLSATLFQTKIAPYTSYVIGARLPKGAAPDALYWDTSDPYFFFRIDARQGHDYAIFGGADHKTGQEPEPKAASKHWNGP